MAMPGARFVIGFLHRLVAVLLVFVGVLGGAGTAMALPGGSIAFNHADTGFVLDGAHVAVNCESCHTQSLFRGTPRECAACHTVGGRAPGKPPSHVPTSQACDSCHLKANWSPARFRHLPTQGVIAGACSACHNGSFAPGKPANHVATTASCDSCHKTAAWTPAGYSHALVAPGTCATCHNGTKATGKPASHIPTTASCDTCHSSGVAFAPLSVGLATMHANMAGPMAAGNCTTCHGGAFVSQNAQAKPATHVATTAQCDTCHSSTSSWAVATFDHATASPAASGRCSDCHGVSALGKPTNHIPTTAQCDSCHNNYTAFNPAPMNHTGTAGACSTCHNGSYNFTGAQSKPTTHIPTTAQCDTCHVNGFVYWSPAVMDHSGQAGRCSTCHSGVYVSQNAQAKPATHIATTAQCDTCHSGTTTWATGSFNHATATPAVAGRCSTCHNGSSALGKPSTHVPTSGQCDNCHNTTAFKPAAMSHAGTAGNCSTCHSGAYSYTGAQGRPANHIPGSAQCDTCHTNFTAFKPATMNHSGLAGTCSGCHSGAYAAVGASAKPVTHIATTAQCDSCHTSTLSWSGATYTHAPSVNGTCSACHNGVTARGKVAGHIPTGAQCDSCHSNATFVSFNLNVTMNHTGLAGQCTTCHSGTYLSQNAQSKPATHVATTAQCDTCHKSTTSWATTTLNHASVTPSVSGRCSTCHGVSALGKPSTHIPTSLQCDTCHTNFTVFNPAQMNHTGTTGNCATCHNGTYTHANAQAKPLVHIPTTAQCDTCHTSTTAFTTVTMNHASTAGPAATNSCSTCHGGAYVSQNAKTKPGNHVATTAQCDTCHKSTSTWIGALYSHPASATGTCSTCHNGTTAPGKLATHIPTTAQCDTCHSNYVAFAPANMNHAGTAGKCMTCHSGNYTAANAQAKPTTHVPTGAQCDTCHTNGFVNWAPGTMNHAATVSPVAAGNCSTCHGGAYVSQNALTKHATHVSTNAQCDTCHTSTTTWATATFAHEATAVGTCSTCHNSTQALGKPVNHVPTTAQCDTCHKNYTAFAPAAMNHAGTAGNCSTCHSGAYVSDNAQAKPATHIITSQQCDSCHNSVAWKPASFSHASVTPGTCATCHNGTQATGRPATHIPTTASCDGCHSKDAPGFAPRTSSVSAMHTAMFGPVAAGNCSTCHSGAYLSVNAQMKPATHVVTTQQCDTCHTSTTSWATATYTHEATATGKCSTCHGVTALGKPTTHFPTTAQCDTCHKNYTAFAPATMSHTGTTGPSAVGNCATCHNGAYVSVNALGKPTTHIPTTAQCDSCHKSGYSAWTPSTMNHNGTTGKCSTCHGGAYVAQNALAKPPTHVVTTQSCDICHSTTAWLPATFAHQNVQPGQCATCHNGTTATGKPALHIPTTQSCDSCHRTGLAWLPLLAYSHAGVTAGSCATCHSPSYPNITSKPANHLPTTAACDACHHTYTAWSPTTYNHAGVVAGTCLTCHSGTYPGVMAKPTNHIPTTLAGLLGDQCSYCHSSTASFSTERMNHGSVQTNCAICHDSTSPYLGSMEKINRARHENAGAKDCSSSGCHRPLGSKGTPYTKWD